MKAFQGILARLIKIVVVSLLIPLVVGLLGGVLEQLTFAGGSDAATWVLRGGAVYVGLHVLLYKPVSWFAASRAMFATLAVWLFGGQVASVEKGAAKAEGGKAGKGAKTKSGGAAAGSGSTTLVAFSPYVIPLWTILVCLAAWVASQWIDRHWIDAPAASLIGASMAFHWLMTADELQQQRSRWAIETYLLALALIFALTLLIAAACVPLAVPGFSFVQALAAGLGRTQALYAAAVEQFFL
jgi:hypothetical protein